MPWRYQICTAECLYSYRVDLPKNLFKITDEELKKVHFRLTCVAQKRRVLSCICRRQTGKVKGGKRERGLGREGISFFFPTAPPFFAHATQVKRHLGLLVF